MRIQSWKSGQFAKLYPLSKLNTHRLLWAFHATQEPEKECFDAESSSILPHTNKGSQSINLDSGVPKEVELEDDVESLDFLMDNVIVPSTHTTYYCKLFEIPYFNDTQHIVKYETIVDEGNEAVVHHMLVFDCPVYIAETHHDATEGECDDFSINMPSLFCRRGILLYGWAVGGSDIYLPKIGGIPLSGSSDTHYILMEMHYDVKCT